MPTLAIDAGTTGVTCLVVSDDLRVQGRAYAEFTQHYPRPGWVEHDAQEIWATTLDAARRALKDARTAAKDVAGIGVTNQRETTVLWDRSTGKPVAPAIVWQDRRTAARCRELAPRWQDTVRQRTGLVLDAYFSATKVEWLLANVPGARAAADAGRLAFGTIDTWLAWMLTGGRSHVTDPTNASRTLLWDIHAGAWDAELLDLFGVPEALLPEVVPSAHVAGRTPARLLGAEVPVAGLVGDQQAALFGQRCFAAGQAKNTYGTGCFLLQHTGQKAVQSKAGLLTTRAASVDDRPAFALEGSVFVGGAAIQWLRDGLRVIQSAPETDALAQEVPDAGGVVVVPAFTGLGAPYWDSDARGAVLGLTRGTDRRHLAYAVLEAIAFQSADLVAAMEKDAGTKIAELRVDGGATASAPLLQIQADVLQRTVRRPQVVETTAMGAAFLAGIATDVWKQKELAQPPAGDLVVAPVAAASEAERRLATWRAAVAAVRAYKPPDAAAPAAPKPAARRKAKTVARRSPRRGAKVR